MDTIIDPLNGNTHSINSVEGKDILQNYIKLYKNGGAEGDESIVVPPLPRWMQMYTDLTSTIELHNSSIARLTDLLRQVEDDGLMDDDERYEYIDFLRNTIEGLERQRNHLIPILEMGNQTDLDMIVRAQELPERNYLDPDPRYPNLMERIEGELETHRNPEALRELERELAEIRARDAERRASRNLPPVSGRWVGDVWVTDTNQDARLANQVEETTSAPSFPAQGYDPTFAAADNDVPINEHFYETRRNNIRRHQRRM